MGFGVFIHRADSIYDDSPAIQYEFPKQYLGRVAACQGDWVIYYEPTKVANSRGYFAMAKVGEIAPVTGKPGMYRALIEPGSYLEFSSPVPFAIFDGLAERGLLNDAGKISGRAQAAVRPMQRSDFERITALGLSAEPRLLPRIDAEPIFDVAGLSEDQAVFEVERERSETTISRAVRDRVFRAVVLRAYGERCGITGLKIINGGGRAEAEAAHIRPVEANGPDTVKNGLALSGTVHWMFDRGLISLSNDLDIMVSRQINDRDSVEQLINPTRRLIGPIEERNRPHPAFLAWHRENRFKA